MVPTRVKKNSAVVIIQFLRKCPRRRSNGRGDHYVMRFHHTNSKDKRIGCKKAMIWPGTLRPIKINMFTQTSPGKRSRSSDLLKTTRS